MRKKNHNIWIANKSFQNVQHLGIILLMMQAKCRINIAIIYITISFKNFILLPVSKCFFSPSDIWNFKDSNTENHNV